MMKMVSLKFSSAVLHFVLLISLVTIHPSEAATPPTYLSHNCENSTSFTPDSTYASNLNLLLPSRFSNASNVKVFSDFYYATAGRKLPDVVFGIFLCRGDVSKLMCQDCVVNASEEIRRRCPDKKEAVIWYEECLLHYSDQPIFAVSDTSSVISRNASTSTTVTDNDQFELLINSMVNTLAFNAANPHDDQTKKFAVGKRNFTSSETVYGLAQCTPDLSVADCSKCFRSAIEEIRVCCNGQRSVRLLLPSCYIMYDLHMFFNAAALDTPAPPLPPPPHPVIHLPEEAIRGGPVHLRWMYPFERFLGSLKKYVKNRARPEGSIAEAYIVNEALTFCSMYLTGVETRFNRLTRNWIDDEERIVKKISVFDTRCRPIGKMTPVTLDTGLREKAEWYVLQNCSEIQQFIEKEIDTDGRIIPLDEIQSKEFPKWFKNKILMAGTLATCAYCESAPEPRQRRGRGGAKGFEIAQKVMQDGKITVEFDEAGGTWKALGKYGAWFESVVGIHTRDICEPFHDAWKDVSDVDKRTIQDRMLDWFNVDYNYKNGILRSVVDREAAKCYKDWKSSLYRYYKRFSGDKFQKISETNRSNRSNLRYPSVHGRLSYSQHRSKKASTETQEPMSAIDNWADMHRRGDSWVNTDAEQTFNTLEEERHRTQTTASATGSPLDEHRILEQVLGTRRGHKKGVGPMLSQKHYSWASPSSAGSFSDATSSAQPEAARMDRYLKKSYQEQMKIYDNQVKMLEFWSRLQPNIQLPTISRPEPVNLDAPLPPSDDDSLDDDAVGDAANLEE